MRHVSIRRSAPVRGRPGRSRTITRLALVTATLAGLALAGAHATAYGATHAPYGGTAAAVPGTVQAANYDTGGQGVGYNVTSVNGSANSYRSDGVDLEACTDTGCGYDIGWTAAGQWFNYTVDVATAGTYSVGFRLASPYGITDGLHIANAAGTNLTGSIAIPDTGGYQDWTTVTASITLPAGVQTLTVDQDSNGWNMHYMSLASTSGVNTSDWYEVVNENSGLCASAAGGGTANGTAVQQLACTGATSQLWQFVPVATGEYEVLNQNAQSAGESWNITGGVGATGSGALLETSAYGGTSNTNELFAADLESNGYYNFVADNSGLCIDTPGASTASGVQLQQYTCNGTGAQEFSLVVPSGGGTGGTGYGGFPSSFWGNTASIPSASGAIEFDFLNATNGQYPNSEVYWSVNGVTESIAQSPYYTMTSCSSCRIYFYLGSVGSDYSDFIELNSSGTTINADTSRVDAFGLPLAIHLHNSNSTDTVVGEDAQVFAESRTALFTQFENFVPAAFKQLATVNAPYTIPAPSDVAAFQPGGADASYMTSYAASEGATETTQEVFGCSGGGSPSLSGDPTLCAALNRCVAQFSAAVQDTPADYYANAPCNYYSAFWHSVAVNNAQYGFAYDDVDGQSSDFNSSDAQYVQVAVGW